MFEYTHENHFKFGYLEKSYFRNRITADEIFHIDYDRPAKKLMSWKEANTQACLDIQKKAKGPIWILFSGGVDSEICIRSFLNAGVPIKVATLRFEEDFNKHELIYVDKLEKKLQIPITYFNLNIATFFQSKSFLEIVDRIQCVSPILACHLWLADQLDGTPVIAQGEPHLKKTIPADYVPGISPYLPSPWKLVESERLCSLYKHFIFQNRAAIPGFFQYLPEQFYSYLSDNPILQDLVNNRIVGKLGTRTSKNQMAYQFYPEIERREKYTGFENIVNLHDIKRKELADRFPASDQNSYIEYQELLNKLKPLENE